MEFPNSRDQRRRWTTLAALTVAVAVTGQRMKPSQRTMRQQTGPDGKSFGIVDLELRAASTQRILDTWGKAGIAAARQQIGLDDDFLVVYAAALAVGSTAAGAQLDKPRTGRLLSRAAVVAGLLDAVENRAMLAVLDGRGPAPHNRIAQAAAIGKFVLVVPAALFSAAGVAAAVRQAVRSRA